jgi:hypothetical protein
MNIFPKNKQSSFTVKLSNEIVLEDDYEVALVEMSYAPYFITELGYIQIYNYFQMYYENKSNSFEIPIEISRTMNSDEFIKLLNELISKSILFEDEFYRFQCVMLPTSENELKQRFELNKSKKENGNLELEVYKLTDSNSNYIIIDKQDSVFSDNFQKVTNPLPYNKELMKWEFTNNQLIELSKTFKLKIFQVNKKFIFYEQSNIFNEKLVSISLNNDFNLFKDLNKDAVQLSTNLNFYKFQNNTLESVDYSKVPYFEITNLISNHKSYVKLINDNTSHCKIVFEGKLANLFLELDQGYIQPNVLYKIENHISTINYAIVYTDIIKSQYFGDINSNILKIIPIKSKDDSEVVTFFDNLHYIPVSKTRISTINIELLDINGNFIHFEDKFSFVIIKLHFRKLNE